MTDRPTNEIMIPYSLLNKLIEQELQKRLKENPIPKRKLYEDRIITEQLDYQNKHLLTMHLDRELMIGSRKFQGHLRDFLVTYRKTFEKSRSNKIEYDLPWMTDEELDNKLSKNPKEKFIDAYLKLSCMHLNQDGKFCEECGTELPNSNKKESFTRSEIFWGTIQFSMAIIVMILLTIIFK